MPVLSQAACGSYSGSESRTETVMGGHAAASDDINCSGLAGNLNIPSREYLMTCMLLEAACGSYSGPISGFIGKRRFPPPFPGQIGN